jgi:hypothetical protein
MFATASIRLCSAWLLDAHLAAALFVRRLITDNDSYAQ